ncbi:unnamed protein product, partial [Choristocarpus tenellus]
QVFNSAIIEALPDALARVDGQLTEGRRPMTLNWTQFIRLMRLCTEGSLSGIASLFEETQDLKLDFLTKKRRRPPPLATAHTRTQPCGKTITATTSPATAPTGPTGTLSPHDSSKDEVAVVPGTPDCRTKTAPTCAQERGDRSGVGASRRWYGGKGQGQRVKSVVGMESLMRPLDKHEVSRSYHESLHRRRQRQKEALDRAPSPDTEPKHPYKACGLCQLFFPADSLSATVSFKVLGEFLNMAGAPSGRFERKATQLCAYHRLHICVFCSQFFDPDYPGGVVHPLGHEYRRNVGTTRGGHPGTGEQGGGRARVRTAASVTGSGYTGKESSTNERSSGGLSVLQANGIIPFFDDRFSGLYSVEDALLNTDSAAGRARS